MLLECPLNTKARQRLIESAFEERVDERMAKAHEKIAANRVSNSVTCLKAFYIPVKSRHQELLAGSSGALIKATGSKLHTTSSWRSNEIEEAARSPSRGQPAKQKLTQYRIIGLLFTTPTVCLAHNGDTPGKWWRDGLGYSSSIRRRNTALLEPNKRRDNVWSAQLARQVAHVPKGDLGIRNTAAVSIRWTLRYTPGTESARARADSIISVAPTTT